MTDPCSQVSMEMQFSANTTMVPWGGPNAPVASPPTQSPDTPGVPPAAPSVSFWLEDGCICNGAIPGRWAAADESAAEVQCCSVSGICTRKDSGDLCLSGDGDVAKATYYDAVASCSHEGMRLCSKQELQTTGAAGCCGTGCQYDNALVWTSTSPSAQLTTQSPRGCLAVPSQTTLVIENDITDILTKFMVVAGSWVEST
eukprot:gene58269-biopygen94438